MAMSSRQETMHYIVRWVKDKSISMISRSDVLGSVDKVRCGTKLVARYDDKVLDAVVLHLGDLDDMNQIFQKLQPASSTDSPKGRGLRMPKRKVDKDFEMDDIEEFEEAQPKKKRDVQKMSAAAAGHDVIEQLLSEQSPAVLNVDHLMVEETEEVLELRKELSRAKKRISELERQNAALLTKLPETVAKLSEYILSLGRVQNTTAPSKTPCTPVTPQVPPSASASLKPKPHPTTPSIDVSPPTSGNVAEDVFEDFAIPPEVLSRATQAKAKGKMVCNLLRSLFTREELAASSLKGSHQALNKRTLDERKVEAITKYVMAAFPDADRPYIRMKITEKLKDERKAFFKGK